MYYGIAFRLFRMYIEVFVFLEAGLSIPSFGFDGDRGRVRLGGKAYDQGLWFRQKFPKHLYPDDGILEL